jgi:F0F1-type ATP synthase assembly protein I
MKLAGLGFELAAAVIGFTFLGYWLGGYFGNASLGLLIGSLMGLTGGMYNLLRVYLATSRRSDKTSRASHRKKHG